MKGKILRVPNGDGHPMLVKIMLHCFEIHGLLDTTNEISFQKN